MYTMMWHLFDENSLDLRSKYTYMHMSVCLCFSICVRSQDTMPVERMRMRPWLEEQINSCQIPGLKWVNEVSVHWCVYTYALRLTDMQTNPYCNYFDRYCDRNHSFSGNGHFCNSFSLKKHKKDDVIFCFSLYLTNMFIFRPGYL